MKSKLSFILSFIFLFSFLQFNLFAQTDSIEVFLIDSYATPEVPHKFIVSFFTSEKCKSQIVLDGRYSFEISNDFTEQHKGQIDLTDLRFKGKAVNFVIICEDSAGNKTTSEVFDFDLPYEPTFEEESNFYKLCLFGGAVFLLPYPNLLLQNGNTYFSLTKEIPVISFRSKNFNYPSGYLSLEYSYVFSSDVSNKIRAGYKHLFVVPGIEYVSPGASVYTDFAGNSGFGLELSAGLFTIADSFTFYGRYRFNFNPGNSGKNFNEISFGLYSSFFSFYLD